MLLDMKLDSKVDHKYFFTLILRVATELESASPRLASFPGRSFPVFNYWRGRKREPGIHYVRMRNFVMHLRRHSVMLLTS